MYVKCEKGLDSTRERVTLAESPHAMHHVEATDE